MPRDNNFLEETIKDLESEGINPEIEEVWVVDTNLKRKMSWSRFKQLANFEYDSGFGAEKINVYLQIQGKDWWMERHEYDGSEWWEFKRQPVLPESTAEVALYFYRSSDVGVAIMDHYE